MKEHKIELKCIKCEKIIFVSKSAIAWGGKDRLCKNCAIQKGKKMFAIYD